MVMSVRDWAVRFSEASDRDPTIGAMARYFTCTYLWDMGLAKVIVRMVDGKVHEINIDPGPMDSYDFALRASPETWREFARPVPEPMYHGIWSASFRRDLKLEGNHLVLMQNLRNFTVQFELLRKVGVPV
ncbi:hypothetical protein [Hoeflea alexandrii]|uniref:hypothetical protein n=1 Tax=Hoeflea alexandrii TaxID=288436 RepID=UPI001D1D3E2F|nr:hypothetical protein [Hoeflea alexandrii]MCC0013326.1 hypothetical protein [Rhodobiaceae bacterium]MCC0037130.1 hypothetical protein [Hoeflea sp.]MCZ4291240.1 hypothetical protein [Hoeflea alexandrii]